MAVESPLRALDVTMASSVRTLLLKPTALPEGDSGATSHKE